MKCIAYTRQDGGISVIYPTPEYMDKIEMIADKDELFIKNKYYYWYFSLILNNRAKKGYTEKHHIVPRSLGGGNKKENIVVLTAKEHYIAHLLLTKILTKKEHERKMINAFVLMSQCKDKNQKRYIKVNSKFYQKLKEQSIEDKKKFRHTEEAKKRISISSLGIKKSPFSENHLINLSLSHKGQSAWNKGIKGESGYMNCFSIEENKGVRVKKEDYKIFYGIKYLNFNSKNYKKNYKGIILC